MKIAHFSDLHYCPKHLAQVDKCFGYAIDHAIAANAEMAVISGDSFDSTMGIHEPAYASYLSRVIQLADRMPVLVLQGTFSHDRPGSLAPLKILKAKYPVLVADRPGRYLLVDEQKPEWVEVNADTIPRSVQAILGVIPSLNKAEPSVMNCAGGAAGYVKDLLESWRVSNEAFKAVGVPTILVMHGSVNGSITESNHAISSDHEFSIAALFSAGVQAIMLGHIHVHQVWQDAGNIAAYAGSIARLVHGHHNPVGYLLWDIVGRRVGFEFVPTPARELMDIFFDGIPNLERLRSLSIPAGAHIRVRYEVDQDHAHRVDKGAVREILLNAGAGDVKIEGTINAIQSVRSAGIGKAYGLIEKMSHWADTTGDRDRLPGLLSRLAEIQAHNTDQIVARLLALDDSSAGRKAA